MKHTNANSGSPNRCRGHLLYSGQPTRNTMDNPSPQDGLVPSGFSLPPSLPDAAALAAEVLGKSMQSQTLRGIRKSTEAPPPYVADAAAWPRDTAGQVIPQVCWGGLPQPLHRANLHYMIAGVPGTGKTLSIRLLLQSVFGGVRAAALPGKDRAVVYDPKLEFYPVFRGMGVSAERLKLLNPFDARGEPWNLATDYDSPSEAHQLAQTIIPVPENHAQPFFPRSAAGLLATVISVNMRTKPGEWDLADILLDSLTPGSLTKTFSRDPGNPFVALAQNWLEDGATKNNILAELSAHVFEYLPIAACWRQSRREGKAGFSIKEFLHRPDWIVLLGANQTHSVALSTLNRLFLKRVAEHTLDHVADGQWESLNRTWLVLDETRELGKVAGLADFINKGRSRGVCTVLGFQDYAGLKQAFGENVAHELTATCAHKLFLRLGTESAEWASRNIGRAEIRETQFSRSAGISLGFNSGQSEGESWSRSERFGSRGGSKGNNSGSSINYSSNLTSSTNIRETDAVMASEIAHLPGFEEGGGLHGFLCTNAGEGKLAQVHQISIPVEYFKGMLAEGSDDRGFIPRPKEHHDLF